MNMEGKPPKTVLVYDLDCNLLSAFTSTADCARKLKLSQGNISNCCAGSLKTYKSLIFSYVALYSNEDREKVEDDASDKRHKRLKQVNTACKKVYERDKDKKREYFRKYYQAHKKELNERKKQQYHQKRYGKTEEVYEGGTEAKD